MANHAATGTTGIDSIRKEDRKFEAPSEFAQQAQIKSLEEYERIYKESVEQLEKFWGRVAREAYWFKPWGRVIEWTPPAGTWSVGLPINISYNCLHSHV